MIENKEISKLDGRLTRWGKARQDAYSASFKDAETLIEALDNLDRKEKLVIQSLISSQDYIQVRANTRNTKVQCFANFARRTGTILG